MEIIQVLCLAAIIAAVAATIWLRYSIIHKYTLLLLLFGLTGIPDLLATVQYAYLNPHMENNPLVRIFLAVPYLIVLGTFLWTFCWISFVELLEKWGPRPAAPIALIALFLGHGWGFSTWLPRLGTWDLLEITAITLGVLLLLYVIYWMGSYGRKKAKQ